MADASFVRSGWSIPVVRLGGISLRVHATFVLLPALVAWTAWTHGREIVVALIFLGLVVTCVVLHELGHAIVARRVGLLPPRIVLYPTGGIAWFDRMPTPAAEWRIAVAGPATNVGVAMMLAMLLFLAGGTTGIFPSRSGSASLADLPAALLWVNVSLAAFNLIPAYPMDGGRILRAVLTLRIGAGRATTAAAVVGQVLAIALASAGLATRNAWFGILAGVIFVGAMQQSRAERSSPSPRVRWAREAMITRFASLDPGDTLEQAAFRAVDSSQQDFPVIDAAGHLRGVLTQPAIFHGLRELGPAARVDSSMERDVPCLGPGDDLEDVRRVDGGLRRLPILVVDDGRVVGLIPTDRVLEYHMIDASRVPGETRETVADGIAGSPNET